MSKSSKSVKSKWVQVTLLVLLCVVVFCLVATTSKIFEAGDLPLNIVTALLEAVITAVITVVLLKGQTEAEELKERNMKVFEIKSKLFQDYIKYVWKVWEDHFLSSEEYKTLIDRFCSELMMYIKDPNNMNKIKDCLLNLVGNVDAINNVDNRDLKSVENLRSNLFDLINALSAELGVGGEINQPAQVKLENSMVSVQFKQTLLKKMDEILVAENSAFLETAIYEHISWFNGVNSEYIFINFKGLKQRVGIIIGPFNGPKYNAKEGNDEIDEIIRFYIYAETGIWQLKEYRAASKGFWRPFINLENKEYRLDQRTGDFQKKGGIEGEIKFHFPAIEKFKENYEQICIELANRARYVFNAVKINNGNVSISIEEFYAKCKDLIKEE